MHNFWPVSFEFFFKQDGFVHKKFQNNFKTRNCAKNFGTNFKCPNFCTKFNKNVFLTDPDLEFWIRVVSRSGSGSGSAGSMAALGIVAFWIYVQMYMY